MNNQTDQGNVSWRDWPIILAVGMALIWYITFADRRPAAIVGYVCFGLVSILAGASVTWQFGLLQSFIWIFVLPSLVFLHDMKKSQKQDRMIMITVPSKGGPPN